ncbi:MAG: hypothetical protein AAGF12_39970 [Myxococcota bacterium]
MNLKRLFVFFVLVDLAALTAYAIATVPLAETFAAIGVNAWGAQLGLDLCIALGFGSAWLWQNAKARGVNPLPWVLAVPFTGSLAILVYAVVHGLRKPKKVHAAAVA